MHWHWWTTNAGGITAVCAIATLLILIGGIAIRYLLQIRNDGREQVERQRAFDLTWYGSKAQYPGDEDKPGMPQRVANIEKNTQGMPERMTDVESRLGKHDDQFADFGKRMTAVEGVILASKEKQA